MLLPRTLLAQEGLVYLPCLQHVLVALLAVSAELELVQLLGGRSAGVLWEVGSCTVFQVASSCQAPEAVPVAFVPQSGRVGFVSAVLAGSGLAGLAAEEREHL